MDNSPWEAMVFINGDWQNDTPCVEKIWEYIQLLKNQEKLDKKKEDQEYEIEKEKEKKKIKNMNIIDDVLIDI